MALTDPVDLYPLSEKAPERAISASGTPLADLTLENVRNGTVGAADITISAETLRLQAAIARSAGRETLARNLERAAELTRIPQDVVLDTYDMLRPGRVDNPARLSGRADLLRETYDAPLTAALIDEAVAVYGRRNLFRRRY